MASAWGSAWSSAWGNAWGVITSTATDEVVTDTGGGGQSKKRRKKQKVNALIAEQERLAVARKQAEIDANYRPIIANFSEFQRLQQFAANQEAMNKVVADTIDGNEEEVKRLIKLRNEQIALILMITIH